MLIYGIGCLYMGWSVRLENGCLYMGWSVSKWDKSVSIWDGVLVNGLGCYFP